MQVTAGGWTVPLCQPIENVTDTDAPGCRWPPHAGLPAVTVVPGAPYAPFHKFT